MDEKDLRMGTGQRILIIILAVILLGGTFLTYLFVAFNNGGSGSGSKLSVEKLTELYDAKQEELNEASRPLSERYFDSFVGYKSSVKAYNSANANSVGLETKDLKEGTGRALEDGDTDYLAYYLGWCPNGDIFDSSYNSNDDPTSLKAPLDPALGLIEGWNKGVVGMKLGGVRQLTVSGELAYGDDDSICGEANSPLKFIILAIEPDANIKQLSTEQRNLYEQLYQAYYESYTQNGTAVGE